MRLYVSKDAVLMENQHLAGHLFYIGLNVIDTLFTFDMQFIG